MTPIFPPVQTQGGDVHFDRILRSLTKIHLNELTIVENRGPYWQASAFRLDHVDEFKALDAKSQWAVLQRCTDDLLREACFIEIAGLSYTAKMSLGSNLLSERLFYSLVAAEEARHFCQLRPFTSQPVLDLGPDQFTGVIGEIVAAADREEAIFMVQVLLEGWGLSHFSWMNSTCTSEALREVFRGILRDEARHHAGGLALTSRKFSTDDKRIANWLRQILHMVRVGPVRVISALEEVSGTLNEAARKRVCGQLAADRATSEKLNLLQKLLLPCVEETLLAQFDEDGLFEPA